MNQALEKLERKLMDELTLIADMLRTLLVQKPTSATVKHLDVWEDSDRTRLSTNNDGYDITTDDESDTDNRILQSQHSRELESIKYNSTIQTTELGRSYLYYWKINDVEKVFKRSDSYVECPVYPLGKSDDVPFTIMQSYCQSLF